MRGEIPNTEAERFSRRSFFGRGAKHGAEMTVGAAGATALLKKGEIEEEIRALDGSVYDEYYRYIEGFKSLGPEAYHRDRYLGRVNQEQIAPLAKETSENNSAFSFSLADRQFVALKLRGKLDEDYSIGLFKARVDQKKQDTKQVEYLIPVIQTPDTDEQTVYFGYLDQGEHEVEIERLPNDIYDTSEITDVEVFTVSGNQNVTNILGHLGDIGLRQDIVESGKIIINIPLSTDLRIRYLPGDPTRLYEVWMDSSGEIGGKPVEERITNGNRRPYDREWMFMFRTDADQAVEEVVYQGKDHSVKRAPLDEPFSLNLDQINNMYTLPRSTSIVANILPAGLLPGTFQRYHELRTPLSVLGTFEELFSGRISSRNDAVFGPLGGIDNARELVDKFVQLRGLR